MVLLNSRFKEQPLIQNLLPFASILLDKVETEFLKTQEKIPLLWFRYIDDIFFIWTHGKEHLETFLQELNNFNPDL